jgi:hypothetical protein
MTDSSKRFVDVEISKETPRVSAAGFGKLLVLTDNVLVTTGDRVKRFTTAASVGDFFTTDSEEYKAANAFFFQDPFLTAQPEEILFGRYDETPTTGDLTIAAALTAIRAVDDDWATLSGIKKYRDGDDTEDMADAIESMQKIFIIATNDVNVLTLGDETTLSYYLKNSSYKRSGTIYHSDSNLYPDISWLGQQLPKPIGSTNWAYKTLAGLAEGALVDIPAVVLSEAQIDAALDVNCNLYTKTMAADFTYFGTMGGGRNADNDGEYIDIIRNIDFLQARITEGLLSLFLEMDIVPFTDGGITTADGRLKSTLQQYGVDQKILINGTVKTFFPKRSAVSVVDRENRFLPDGTFEGEIQGAMNTIQIRGKVRV